MANEVERIGRLAEVKSQDGASKVMDLYFVYKFAKFIALPWEEWDK